MYPYRGLENLIPIMSYNNTFTTLSTGFTLSTSPICPFYPFPNMSEFVEIILEFLLYFCVHF